MYAMNYFIIGLSVLAFGVLSAILNRPMSGKLIADATVNGVAWRALRTEDSAVYVVDPKDTVMGVLAPSVVKEMSDTASPAEIGLFAIKWASEQA